MAMPAHISILRVLELLSVEPTRIYGTSAGAVIGGMRAAGMSTAEIEEATLDIRSADDLFGFASRYPALRLAALAIRRQFQTPKLDESGIYDIDRVEEHVARILERYVGGVPRMRELARPFSCVGVDIGGGSETGEGGTVVRKEVFSPERTPNVRLSDAIGASMAIPGVITPKKIGDTYYMDGAVAEHLPTLSAYNDWRRRGRGLRRRRLAIIASDLGYGGEVVSESDLADPIDLVVYSKRIQERLVNHYNLLHCHRPRRGSTVILIRPRGVRVELYEIEKVRVCLHAAYVAACDQLSGEGFLAETDRAMRQAMAFLDLEGNLA